MILWILCDFLYESDQGGDCWLAPGDSYAARDRTQRYIGFQPHCWKSMLVGWGTWHRVDKQISCFFSRIGQSTNLTSFIKNFFQRDPDSMIQSNISPRLSRHLVNMLTLPFLFSFMWDPIKIAHHHQHKIISQWTTRQIYFLYTVGQARREQY